MNCIALGIKLLLSRVTTTFPGTRCSIQTLAESEKSRDPKGPPSTMQEESLQSHGEEPTEGPENHVEAEPVREDPVVEHYSLPGQESQAPNGEGSGSTSCQIWPEGGHRQKAACGGEEGKEAKAHQHQEAEAACGGKKGCCLQEASHRQEARRQENRPEEKPAV